MNAKICEMLHSELAHSGVANAHFSPLDSDCRATRRATARDTRIARNAQRHAYYARHSTRGKRKRTMHSHDRDGSRVLAQRFVGLEGGRCTVGDFGAPEPIVLMQLVQPVQERKLGCFE